MQEPGCYENYPAATVIASNALSFLIYGISAVILYRFGIILVAAYVLVVLFLELRLMGGHCTDCYYYGKTCAFGKGRVSALFFKRGDQAKFSQNSMTAWDLVPDFLVFMAPVIIGIVSLIQEFNWMILALVVSLPILGFYGNALVRGQAGMQVLPAEKTWLPGRAVV